jgi:hypothetical protein
MKKFLLLIHIFPREIDDFDNIANQLKVASKYLSDKISVDTHIVLNLNNEIINWSESNISKNFILDKFNHILTKFDWTNQNHIEINYDDRYWGIVDQRVHIQSLTDQYEGFILLDLDIIFSDYIFYYLQETLEHINDDLYIISPQVYKFWDQSWNLLSYSPYDGTDINELDPYIVKTLNQDIELIQNKQIKFAGGWFTTISSKLLSKINFPPNVKGYGLEDTFIAESSKKLNATQYIMKGIVIQENRKYLNNSIYINHIKYNSEKLSKINNATKQIFTLALQSL